MQEKPFVPAWAPGCNINPISLIKGSDGGFLFCADTRFGFRLGWQAGCLALVGRDQGVEKRGRSDV